jgi:periplasmic protein TonB
MENKKSLLITFTLIISAHLLLFANLELEEKVVVAQNKPAPNISKINLKNVVIKKPEPKIEPVVEPVVKPIVEKIIEKSLPETKSKNIVKQEKKKEKKKKEVKKVEKKILEKVEKTEEVKVEQKAEPIVQEMASKEVIKQEDTIDPSQIQALEDEYLSKLRYIIEKNKIYPQSAKRLNQMGKVHVNFIISKDGQIKNIKIVKDSNYQRLNDAALEILAKINKFEPIPSELNKNSWEITVPIVYQIKRS